MKTVDSKKIIMLIHAQARSADLWVTQWERHKNVSGVRNAAMAIGKIFGLISVLSVIYGGEDDIPENIIALMKKYSDIWGDLSITEDEIDAVISVDG